MLATQIEVSDGTLSIINVGIQFFEQVDISVSLDQSDLPLTLGVDYVWSAATTITFLASASVPGGLVPNGVEVFLRRDTKNDFMYNILDGGAPFSRLTLDENYKQLLFLTQEFSEGLGLDGLRNNLNMNGYKITNLGNPTNPQDAASKAYVDLSLLNTVRGSAGEVLTPLPSALSRANKVLGFDAAGNPYAQLPVSGSGTELALDLANAADTSKGVSMLGYYGLTLREALSLKRSIRTFGAIGNGADDTVAINAAEVWLATSTINRPLTLLIDTPVRYTQSNKLGAITLIGVSGWTIEWQGSGCLLMDNLVAGLGTSGGVFGSGPARDITLVNPYIEWVTRPTTRSTGDGYMFKGYPSDENCISNVRVLGRSRIVNAPQTSGIFLGCKDPFVQSHQGVGSWADNLHFNACQRPVVLHNYGVSPGDDVMALVTYYHPTDVGGGGVNWQISRTPYNQPTLGEWNNTDCFVSGITADSAQTNTLRLAGVNGGTIGPIKCDGTTRGMICDAGLADGVQYKWSYLASRKVRVESITESGGTIGAFFEVFNPTLVAADSNPTSFTDFDVSVGPLTSRNASAYGARVNGANGVVFDSIDSVGAVLGGVLIQRASRVAVREILGADLVTVEHSCSHLTFGDVECNRVVLAVGEGPSSNIKFGRVRSTNSPVNAFLAVQVDGLEITSLEVQDHNTSGGASNNSALNIQACKRAHIGALTADASNINARLMEIGGGSSSTIRGDDIRIDIIHSRLARTDVGITVQGGAFGPLNLKYAGKWRNGSTDVWSAITPVDTFA